MIVRRMSNGNELTRFIRKTNIGSTGKIKRRKRKKEN